MYESFFGLDRRPFAATPDPDCFVETRTARAAHDALERSVRNGGGIGLLVAPAGLGKTLLARRLAAALPDEYTTALLPSANFTSRRALLQSLLYELGQPYARRPEQELRIDLTETLRRLGADGRRTLLLLDEAHLLGKPMLEELRLLTQLQEGPRPLVAVVLAGQPALEETLAEPGMEAFNQRLVEQCYLESLTREESREYVARRLALCGGNPAECLDDETLRFVCEVADGSPRALNQICDHTLLLAFAEERRPADLEIAHAAYEDVRQLPLHWNPPLVVDAPADGPGEVATEFENDGERQRPSHSDRDVAEDLDADAADDVAWECGAAFETSLGDDADVIEVGASPDDAVTDSTHFEVGAQPRHDTDESPSEPTRLDLVEDRPTEVVEAAEPSTAFECGWEAEPDSQSVEVVHDDGESDVGDAPAGEPRPNADGFFELALDGHDSTSGDARAADDAVTPSADLRHRDFVPHERTTPPPEEARPMPPYSDHRNVSPALAGLDTPIAWSEEYVVDHHSVARDPIAKSEPSYPSPRPTHATPPPVEPTAVEPIDVEPIDVEPIVVETTVDVVAPPSVEECSEVTADEAVAEPVGEARRNLPLLESALAPLVGRVGSPEEVPADPHHVAPVAGESDDAWRGDVVELEDEIERELNDIAAETARAVSWDSSSIVEEHRSLAESERRSVEPRGLEPVEPVAANLPRPEERFRPSAPDAYDVVEPEDFGTDLPPLTTSSERPYARLFSEIRRQWSAGRG